ncbi:MAG: DUF4159 domain-containing protein [Phycisphaerae bacterium]
MVFTARHTGLLWSILLPASLLGGRPASAEIPTHKAVEDATRRGVEALLNRIVKEDVIRYRRRRGDKTLTTVRGRVLRSRGATVEFRTADGRKLTIRKVLIRDWTRAGFVKPEMPRAARGGPSALVAFALLSAGVKTTEPRMARLLDALAAQDTREAGTYVHSLRAVVWSLLLDGRVSNRHKRRYRRLLDQDMNWLMRAMSGDGGYGYGQSGGRSDHSNTQFANLGLWSGAIANIEVARRYWLATAKHWINAQHPGGGWGYQARSLQPRSSMTVAGCNSLYIVLDRYYAQADEPYRYFEGVRPNKKARKRMERIYRAIEDGDAFLKLHPPNILQFYGYELFGLERLGLASGRAQIGGVDWFRHYTPLVARRIWGKNLVADAFALIFLVHGQAPILIQKLEHGGSDTEWNFYHRDLAGLTRYLSQTFERLYRWQRIPADASVESLRDAPILYISGRRSLVLSDPIRSRIRAFVDDGGTVFLHADRAGKAFTQSATRIFEKMFVDRGLRFEGLPETHPLYRCHFGGGEKGWKRHIPLAAIADGPRLLVVLCPVDIAGAWHQDRRRFKDLFKIMANLRVYCAPPYARLPSVLRSASPAQADAPPRGTLRLRRFYGTADWNAHLGAWKRRRGAIRRRTGVELLVSESPESWGPEQLRQYDIVYLTTRGAADLDRDGTARLLPYLRTGGLLLIDSADGFPEGNAAVRRLVDALDIGEKGVLENGHAIVSGAMPGGRPLSDLETTQAGTALYRPNAPPPILLRRIDGRVAVVACPFDLIAGLDRQFVWNRIGYTPSATARLVDNILLWRLHGRSRKGG